MTKSVLKPTKNLGADTVSVTLNIPEIKTTTRTNEPWNAFPKDKVQELLNIKVAPDQSAPSFKLK